MQIVLVNWWLVYKGGVIIVILIFISLNELYCFDSCVVVVTDWLSV